MKIHNSIHSHGFLRLLLMVPVITSLTFSACAAVAATAQKNERVNFHSTVTREQQTGDYVHIGPATYKSEDRGFGRPWPFGSEASAQ